jgi:hypothetical protein
VPKNRLKLPISCLILLHMHVYFLDLILLWHVIYFREIKPKCLEIGSWTKLSHQLTDHRPNPSRMPQPHSAYDPYAPTYGPYGLHPEKISKDDIDLMPRFPSNLVDPLIYIPQQPRVLDELHFGHHLHLFHLFHSISTNPSHHPFSRADRDIGSPESREEVKERNRRLARSNIQSLIIFFFCILCCLDILCGTYFVLALCIFIVFLYTAMSD